MNRKTPISIDELKEYVEETAEQIVDELKYDKDWFPYEGSIEDDLRVRTTVAWKPLASKRHISQWRTSGIRACGIVQKYERQSTSLLSMHTKRDTTVRATGVGVDAAEK